MGFVAADALQIEQPGQRRLVDHSGRVLGEVLLQVMEREREDRFAEALVLGLGQQILAADGQLVADRGLGFGVGGDEAVDRIADRTHQRTAVGVGHELGEIGWRRTGVRADHVEFWCIRRCQLHRRRRCPTALRIPPKCHWSMGVQRCAGQPHRGAGGVEHRLPLGDPVHIGVRARSAQPVVVGNDDRESARHHRGDEPLLRFDRDVQAAGEVDALVEQS